MAARDFGRRPVDPARLREAEALLSDPHAFDPVPVVIEAPRWLEGVCWVALIAITIGTTILLWRL